MSREAFENLSAEEQMKLVWPRVEVMISMIKDMKLNMDKFLIPKGAMKEDSMFYKEFMSKYYLLFPKEIPVEETKSS